LSQYELIIAEILLQRTKAETVAKFYHEFILRFPTWSDLHLASNEVVEQILKPIGLYRQRAKRLKELAKEMVFRSDNLPTSRDELETMPMFGQYIINSIQLLIFKKPAPLIDVNMARLLERYFKPRQLSDIRYDKELQVLAHQVVKHKNPSGRC
jgi:A/G-specific adenine glycosylase